MQCHIRTGVTWCIFTTQMSMEDLIFSCYNRIPLHAKSKKKEIKANYITFGELRVVLGKATLQHINASFFNI